MKRLNFKTTSKKANFEVFSQLSTDELLLIKGGTEEIPPEEKEQEDPTS